MMDKDKKHPIPLPSEDAPDYFEKLRNNCILMYEKFLDDRLALDFNKVVGKMRPMILEDKVYQQETKHLRAQAILQSVEDLNDIAFSIDNGFTDEDEEEEAGYDPRGLGKTADTKKKKKRGANVSDKDLVAMRLKALETRREMLGLDRADGDNEESDGLNIFFVGMTREEFEKFDTVEVHEGKEVDKFEQDQKSVMTGKTLKKREDSGSEADDDLVEGVDYEVDGSGSIVER